MRKLFYFSLLDTMCVSLNILTIYLVSHHDWSHMSRNRNITGSDEARNFTMGAQITVISYRIFLVFVTSEARNN